MRWCRVAWWCVQCKVLTVYSEPRLLWSHMTQHRQVLLEAPQSYCVLDFELSFGCCVFGNLLMLPKIYMSLISRLRILYRDITHNLWSFALLKIIVKRILEIIWNRAKEIVPGRSETEGAFPHLTHIKMFMVPVDCLALSPNDITENC